MVRGTAKGLELVFGGASFDAAWDEIRARLSERPDFYRGAKATAIVEGVALPDGDAFADVFASVRTLGIELAGVYGDAAVAATAERAGLVYLGAAPTTRVSALEPKRKRGARVLPLTDAARSLDADFAGARADFAVRRDRIVAARERGPAKAAPAPPAPTVHYHRGTLRGGQSLQHVGDVIVLGDVNPGAEIVASGDVVIFGALLGTAHAGAQGELQARVAALDLRPTQLRIATFIAADAASNRPRPQPEIALVQDGRIAIQSYSAMRGGR